MRVPGILIRVAAPADAEGVTAVLTASYATLLAPDYEAGLLTRALPLMTRANPRLLASGTYLVAEAPSDGIVACGGWTIERPGTNEIVNGLGHVRHFATDPRWTGHGIATCLLSRCLQEAQACGVRAMEAYSTLSAEGFYRAAGFVAERRLEIAMGPDVTFPSILMRRQLD